jgi:hypothetical protein
VRGVLIRPEEGDELVASREAPGRGQRQVDQQGEAFGLSEDAPDLMAVGAAEVERAQGTEVNADGTQIRFTPVRRKKRGNTGDVVGADQLSDGFRKGDLAAVR